jgi:hypothetical protein
MLVVPVLADPAIWDRVPAIADRMAAVVVPMP